MNAQTPRLRRLGWSTPSPERIDTELKNKILQVPQDSWEQHGWIISSKGYTKDEAKKKPIRDIKILIGGL